MATMGRLVINNRLGQRLLHYSAQENSKGPNGRGFCGLYPSRGTQSPKTHITIGYRHGQQGHVKPGNVLSRQQPPWSKTNRRQHHQPIRLRNHSMVQESRPKRESPKGCYTTTPPLPLHPHLLHLHKNSGRPMLWGLLFCLPVLWIFKDTRHI